MADKAGHTRRSSDPNFTHQVEAAVRNRELLAYLAKWRAEHDLSQAETAKRMHTSQPAVARLESHQHDAQLSTLARYVASLGLSLHFSLQDENGQIIWSSDEASEIKSVTQPRGKVRSLEPAHVELDPADFFVFRENWHHLSEGDLERRPFVITSSEEPGLSALYRAAEPKTAHLVELKSHVARTEKAEGSKVIAIFVSDDPDPVIIAVPAAVPGTSRLEHVFTLEAKLSESIIGDLSRQNLQAPHEHVVGLVDFSPRINFTHWLTRALGSHSENKKS